LFRHVGGDCTPNSFNGKDNRKSGWARSGRGRYGGEWTKIAGYFWSASFRPAFRLSKFRSVLSTRE
jgi:hypothetical protein